MLMYSTQNPIQKCSVLAPEDLMLMEPLRVQKVVHPPLAHPALTAGHRWENTLFSF